MEAKAKNIKEKSKKTKERVTKIKETFRFHFHFAPCKSTFIQVMQTSIYYHFDPKQSKIIAECLLKRDKVFPDMYVLPHALNNNSKTAML